MRNFSIIILSLFICLACDDDSFDDTTLHKQIALKKISFNKFSQDQRAFDKFNQVRNSEKNFRTSSQGMLIDDFYYDTDLITLYEKDGLKTYTMPIYRGIENEFVENLSLNINEGGEYFAYIVRYNLDEQDKLNLINNLPIANLSQKTSLLSLENLSTNNYEARNSGGEGGSLWVVNGTCCYYIDHVGADFVTFVYAGSPKDLDVPGFEEANENDGGGGFNFITIGIATNGGGPGGEFPFPSGGGGSGPDGTNVVFTPVAQNPNIVQLIN